MMWRHVLGITVVLAGLLGACAIAAKNADPVNPVKSKADTLPRKVVVATIMQRFRGTVEERLTMAEEVIAEAKREAEKKMPGKRLDLIVVPEYAITTKDFKAVKLEGEVEKRLGEAAKKTGAYVIVPMVRDEGQASYNEAVIFDRSGKVFGVYRKVHAVVVDDKGNLECGVKPGAEYPVFDCDFGKLGIQICWDMAYNDGWDALGKKGAEIVVSPSASPATIRIAGHAVRNNFWVITSTVRDNVTLFNPLGHIAAQSTDARVMVCEVDLSYALLGWSDGLRNGKAMTEKFGGNVGYTFSVREDGGVFWSNDPKRSIGSMYRELGLREITVDIAETERVIDQIRGGKAK